MQRLIKDIANHKIERIVAIKTDRLTNNNYYELIFIFKNVIINSKYPGGVKWI